MISELNAKRQQFVEAEMKKSAAMAGADSFDTALRKAIREQATGKGFRFEQHPVAQPAVALPASDDGC